MDFQSIINIAASVGLGVGGWFARRMWDAMDGLRDDVARLREELPKTYATRDDVKDGVAEIKQLLLAIDSKLDRKQDKHEAR